MQMKSPSRVIAERVDRIGGALNDPSTSDSAKLVLDHAYSLPTGTV